MGKMVFTNGYVLVNGVDLSDHVEQVTLDAQVAEVDVTAMGAGGKQRLAGLQDNKVTLTFWQDFAASKVDATMWGIVRGGTAVPIKLGANGTAFSATNPSYSASVVLTGYQPLAGKVGDGLQSQVTLVVDGTVTPGTS